MNIIIKATNFELTPALKDYIEKRLQALEKVGGGQALISVEIGKTTEHHKNGDLFKTEINVSATDGAQYRTASEKQDQYESIDDAVTEVRRAIVERKEKSQTLWKRGAQKIKDILKGFRE